MMAWLRADRRGRLDRRAQGLRLCLGLLRRQARRRGARARARARDGAERRHRQRGLPGLHRHRSRPGPISEDRPAASRRAMSSPSLTKSYTARPPGAARRGRRRGALSVLARKPRPSPDTLAIARRGMWSLIPKLLLCPPARSLSPACGGVKPFQIPFPLLLPQAGEYASLVVDRPGADLRSIPRPRSRSARPTTRRSCACGCACSPARR